MIIQIDALAFEKLIDSSISEFIKITDKEEEYPIILAFASPSFRPYKTFQIERLKKRGNLIFNKSDNNWVNAGIGSVRRLVLDYRLFQGQKPIRINTEIIGDLKCEVSKKSGKTIVSILSDIYVKLLDSFDVNGSSFSINESLRLSYIEMTNSYIKYTIQGIKDTYHIIASYSQIGEEFNSDILLSEEGIRIKTNKVAKYVLLNKDLSFKSKLNYASAIFKESATDGGCDTGEGGCSKCNCKGFRPDYTEDPPTCLNGNGYNGPRCGHLEEDHH